LLPEFKNKPLSDFSNPAKRNAFQAALSRIEARLPLQGQNRIAGQRVGAVKTFDSVNPADPKQVIGHFPEGTVEDANRAVEAAAKAFESWSRTAPRERWEKLLQIASILRNRKHEFSSMMVLEESKSWVEADADTAEAIDFCEYYAREMERLANPPPLVPYPGEKTEIEYLPLGVCAVIPPWNFPLSQWPRMLK
jgi:1-pyrroline-5-carboxylate dehydrogenase